MDILGFKNQVSGSLDSNHEIQRIHSGLLEIYKAFNDHFQIKKSDSYKTSKKVTQFSDSITVSYNLSEESAVYHLLNDTYMLQIDLLRWGISVRGGIAIGKLYHDEKLVFGPALVEAVELEKYAIYPRVILSKEIIAIGKKNHAEWHSSEYEEEAIISLIEQDLDGAFYINYFGVSPYNFDDSWNDVFIYLSMLKKFIEDSIRRDVSAGVNLKLKWMMNKFNNIIFDLEKENYSILCGWEIPDDVEVDFTSINHIES